MSEGTRNPHMFDSDDPLADDETYQQWHNERELEAMDAQTASDPDFIAAVTRS